MAAVSAFDRLVLAAVDGYQRFGEQTELLDIALCHAIKSADRLNAVEVVVDVDLQ
ncbi:hypothetical protein D3C84_694690 [compost metagenome]